MGRGHCNDKKNVVLQARMCSPELSCNLVASGTITPQRQRFQKQKTMSAGLEPTTFGEFQREPKTNALPLRQGSYVDFDVERRIRKVYTTEIKL